MGKKVLVTDSDTSYVVLDTSVDFHTKHGAVKKADFKKKKLKTNKGIEMSCFDARFLDVYKKIKRTAQIMLLKEIGSVIVLTGIGKNTVVFDAGTGTGALSCFLANICKHVYTFDIDDKHMESAKDNAKMLNLKNITFAKRDIVEKGFPKKNADVITLDLREPWLCLEHAQKALKSGGFLVCYSPNITQMQKVVNDNNKLKEPFVQVKTIETIERMWKIDGEIVRPQFGKIGHTGFFTVMRKV
jgi:tRNA (adenine57-N1/adenine58-N1)-methyltransferase